jgi:hypothetical protein
MDFDDINIVEIDCDADDPFGPCWGVLDPSAPLFSLFQDLLGTDVLPIVDALVRWVSGPGIEPKPGFQVDPKRLTPDQLTILCRHIARESRVSEPEAYLLITQGIGVVVASRSIKICPDPEIGRAWWRAIAEAEKTPRRSPPK